MYSLCIPSHGWHDQPDKAVTVTTQPSRDTVQAPACKACLMFSCHDLSTKMTLNPKTSKPLKTQDPKPSKPPNPLNPEEVGVL